MNIELFDKAVAVIDRTPDDQLELGYWQAAVSIQTVDVFVYKPEHVTCETIACAGGWLALQPEFREQGLSSGNHGIPTYCGYVGYSALACLFNIPHRVALDLFWSSDNLAEESILFDDGCNEQQMDEAWHCMTDRQLWLSRARVVRAQFLQGAYAELPTPSMLTASLLTIV